MFDAVWRYKDLGITNFILSNNIREFSSSWKSMLPENVFDEIIDSSEVGIRKPDPKYSRWHSKLLTSLQPRRYSLMTI